MKDSKLYKLTIQRDNNWKTVTDLSDVGIKKITRLATNQSATKLVIAGDVETTQNSFKKPEEIALAKLNQETALKNEANTSRLSAIIQKQ
jgi:carbamate kinase